jgi:hypothetical protein
MALYSCHSVVEREENREEAEPLQYFSDKRGDFNIYQK